MNRRVFVLVLLFAAAGGRAGAERLDYVGAETCGRCHRAAYETWRASAHARADENLGSRRESVCLGCHTTGDAPAGRPLLAGVQCEACHGPGAAYAAEDIMRNPTLAGFLGLRDLSTPQARAALCARCHDQPTRLAPFDAEAAFRAIAHPAPSPPAAEPRDG